MAAEDSIVIVARCPVCSQQFAVPRPLFAVCLWTGNRMTRMPCKQAYMPHKDTKGNWCPGNGVAVVDAEGLYWI